MANIPWSTESNLEVSIKKFIESKITTDSLTVNVNGTNRTPEVRIGQEFNSDWNLPVIALYIDSETSPRVQIGSDKRDHRYLVIIDIFCNNNQERVNLAGWVKEKINDNITYYTYTRNAPNPDSPNETDAGSIGFDFVNNLRLDLGNEVDLFDRYRHRISINCWIQLD